VRGKRETSDGEKSLASPPPTNTTLHYRQHALPADQPTASKHRRNLNTRVIYCTSK